MRTKRDRKREFSEIRLTHSRSILQKSRIDDRNLSTSKITANPKESHRHAHTHEKDGLVCVNCYNKKLIDGKRERQMRSRLKEKEEEGMTLSKLEQNKNRQNDAYQRQLKRVTEFNLRKMEENQKKKESKKVNQTIQEQDFQKTRQQYLKQLQYKRNLQNQRRNKLKEELQKQIQQTHKRRLRQLQEDEKFRNTPLIDKPIVDEQTRQARQNEYKRDLLNQINQQKIKKQKEQERKQDNSLGNELQLVTFAQNRKKQAEEYAAKIRQFNLEEAKRRSMNNLSKKGEANRMRQINEAERRKAEKQNIDFKNQQQDLRRNQIDKYLNDLKSQIQINKTKRQQQMNWINKATDNYILNPKTTYVEDNCACCEKTYPKNHLSPYIDIVDR